MKICDRCKAGSLDSHNSIKIGDLDLCLNCTNDLNKWVKEGKTQ